MNSLTLAYLGDAVYELYVREFLINKGITKVNNLQKEAVKFVSAKSECSYLASMIENNFLTEDEMDIVNRARNHKSHRSKSTDIVTYKKSTGLEALIGHLYLNNKKRLEEVISFILGGV